MNECLAKCDGASVDCKGGCPCSPGNSKDPEPDDVLGVPYITPNIYCKSCNLTNTDIQNYSIDIR